MLVVPSARSTDSVGPFAIAFPPRLARTMDLEDQLLLHRRKPPAVDNELAELIRVSLPLGGVARGGGGEQGGRRRRRSGRRQRFRVCHI